MTHLTSLPLDPSTRHAWAQLLDIKAEPKPLIKPVDDSHRAFALYPSLLTVRSDIRKLLTRGWYEYDLKSAQFAAIAALWPVPELQTFLASNASLWEHLAKAMKVDLSLKPALKVGVYALAYGAGKDGIRRGMLEELGLELTNGGFYKQHAYQPHERAVSARVERIQQMLEQYQQQGYALTYRGKRIPVSDLETARAALARQTRAAYKLVNKFLKVPIIKTVLEARERKIQEIMNLGYVQTIFGDVIEVRNHDDARSALAQQAQALEVALIQPIYDLARTTDEFKVTLYSFDGVTIAYKHPDSVGPWEARIKEAVVKKAQALGVLTYLEGELNT